LETIMLIRTALLSLLLVAQACSLEVADLNNPDYHELENDPSRPKFAAAAAGLLVGNRLDYAEANGYVAILGVIGREAYNFDTADPRYISELLAGDLSPGSARFGGNFWVVPYRNIRNANVVLNALALDEARPAPVLSLEEMETLRGYTKTIQAMDFLTVISTRAENGAPIDVNREGASDIAPIVSEAEVYQHIFTLLDESRHHLAAGNSFPFQLPSGFDGFSHPETFVKFNRALKARVAMYRNDLEAAEEALSESFLSVDPATPLLDLGVYHNYGTGKGDRQNGLIDPNLYAHPSIMKDAELKADGKIDDRANQKIFLRADPRKVQGLESQFGFARYQNPADPAAAVPIIRNEELILLRAELRIAQNDIAGAQDDLNFIREKSGGLVARHDLDATSAIDELLRQRRYSLMFEAGHRWIDMCRFGRLADLPVDGPDHKIHHAFPIPVQETDPR
jgi:hypothetical protein